MAGFQKFPVPRHILTRSYWAYSPKSFANAASILISGSLLTLALYRYSLLRTVIASLTSDREPRIRNRPRLGTSQRPTPRDLLINLKISKHQ